MNAIHKNLLLVALLASTLAGSASAATWEPGYYGQGYASYGNGYGNGYADARGYGDSRSDGVGRSYGRGYGFGRAHMNFDVDMDAWVYDMFDARAWGFERYDYDGYGRGWGRGWERNSWTPWQRGGWR